MTDLFDDVFPPAPRRPVYKETGVRQRFRDAFAAELREHPDRAPGPRALANRMGWKSRNLNGSTTTLRRKLLRDAGFYYDEMTNRWESRKRP
jgi:hypothetical protein